jgi:hypothetical protein
LPEQGSTFGQVSMPLTQTRSRQREKGQALDPSAHCWQGARLRGQSPSVLQVEVAQVGNDPIH